MEKFEICTSEYTSVKIPVKLVVSNRNNLKGLFFENGELAEQPQIVFLDFENTREIDSTGLGVLVAISRKLQPQMRKLRLINLNPNLRTIFLLSKLDTILQVA